MKRALSISLLTLLTACPAPEGGDSLSGENVRVESPSIAFLAGEAVGPTSGIRVLASFGPSALGPAPVIDGDEDGVPDDYDNCREAPNGPLLLDAGGNSQLDVDGDGFGNSCDCDLDNDGACGVADFTLFLDSFSGGAGDGGSDLDGSGAVGIEDFTLFLGGFARGAPGP